MGAYKEIICTEACHKLKRKIPYGWDLNIYRGCGHGCRYCYAVYSHDYLGEGSFFKEIQIKTNIAEALEKQLSGPTWNREVINIGGVTDSYQPCEGHYRLMPDILRLLIKYRTPCIISSKSDLILRDYDLIAQLADITYVNIAQTITCMDEQVRQKLEPGGAPSIRRFEVLKAFSKTNASTGLHFMPVVPYLTDGRENVKALYAAAKDAQVSYVLPGVLYLRGKTRNMFFEFIAKEYPELTQPLLALYKTGGAGKAYKDSLYPMVNEIKKKCGLSGSYMRPMKEKLSAKPDGRQLSLFDEQAK